jgi:hypothetical protein
MRVGAGDAIGELARSRRVLGQVLILQAVAPFGLLVVLLSLDAEITPFLLAVVLMLSAPSVTGAPNFAIMTGDDPAPAMRILVLGTALFPILVLPIFWLLPQLGGTAGLWASARLVAVILIAVGAGFAVRHLASDRIGPAQIRAFDGLNAFALGVIVVALMSAIGPLLQENPGRLMTWLIAVFAVNFGLQLFVFASYRGEGRAAVSMIAGNRNIALFLIALPETVVDPLLIFIGCYQIPMYLTPILLRRLYAPS